MKVLQVLPALNSGGVERGTLELGRALVAQGHESWVVSAGGRMQSQLLEEGSHPIKMPVGEKKLSTLTLVRPFRKLLKSLKPDIVHVRSRLPAWVAWLAWKSLAKNNRPHFVSTVHGSYSVSFYSAVMTKGERVIAVSDHIRQYILQNYPKVDQQLIRVIHRGVDPECFIRGYYPNEMWLQQWYQQYPQTRDKTLVVLPARITRWKGQEDFLKIIAQLKTSFPNLIALIVGDADPRRQAYFNEIKLKAKTMGLTDVVVFTGHRSDLKQIMALSKLVFVLSQQPEAFGRTALEALSLGVPVVGYDHGGTSETLSAMYPEGKVEARNWQAAAIKSQSILEHAVPVENATAFTLGAMTSQTIQCYQELLK